MQGDEEAVRNVESCILGQAERHMEETTGRDSGPCRDCRWFSGTAGTYSDSCLWMFGLYGVCSDDPERPTIVRADDTSDYCFEERG